MAEQEASGGVLSEPFSLANRAPWASKVAEVGPVLLPIFPFYDVFLPLMWVLCS